MIRLFSKQTTERSKGRVSLVALRGLEGIKVFFGWIRTFFFPTCTQALESLEMFMLLFMTPRVGQKPVLVQVASQYQLYLTSSGALHCHPGLTDYITCIPLMSPSFQWVEEGWENLHGVSRARPGPIIITLKPTAICFGWATSNLLPVKICWTKPPVAVSFGDFSCVWKV